jgi:hypothetical protein
MVMINYAKRQGTDYVYLQEAADEQIDQKILTRIASIGYDITVKVYKHDPPINQSVYTICSWKEGKTKDGILRYEEI